MKRSIVLIVTLIFLSMHSGQAMSAQRELGYVPGEILVKYKDYVAGSSVRTFQDQRRIKALRSFKNIGVRHVKIPEDMEINEALEAYRNNPDVEYAEPNYYRYAAATIPNDPDFENLWGLNNTGQVVNGTSGTADADMDVSEAWDINTGSNDIIIAVMDSGVAYDHPDLQNNIWSNKDETINGSDDDGNGYVDDVRGWDFVHDNNDPVDPDGHGTHVSGTIAARGNNSTGIAGVCWTAKIMPLKFLGAAGAGGNVADEISAINYAVDNGARIINASFTGSSYSQSEKNAIASAASSGVLFIAAAGNGGDDGTGDGWNNDISGQEIYPASYDLPNIISVAATNQNDNIASFSNYGETSVDVAAPGQNIYSAQPARQTVWSENFDDGDISDWKTGGLKDDWGLSNTTYASPSYSLADSSLGQDYRNYTDSWAQAPSFDLSPFSALKLELELTGHSEQDSDFLYKEASIDGTNWTTFDSISGDYSDQWLHAANDLGAYDGQSPFYLRFAFTSNASTNYDGWYIDDIKLTAASSSYSSAHYQYKTGASMAAPQAAGLAGLIWSNSSGLTMTEVKNIILNHVDPLSSLSDKVATGGRINALNALFPPPSGLSATKASSLQIDLSWTDNSSDEAGFKIERKTGAGGTYTQIATVSADVTSYTDTVLSESATYYYRVRAYNNMADSNYSNAASTSTSAASGSGDGGGGGGCFISTVAP